MCLYIRHFLILKVEEKVCILIMKTVNIEILYYHSGIKILYSFISPFMEAYTCCEYIVYIGLQNTT